jgi:hypothetical protein
MAMSDVERLVELLREHRLLLFAGAGLSRRLQYPLWKEYLEALEDEIGTKIDPRPDSELEWAEELKRRFASDERLDDYHAHIEQTFSPAGRAPYDELHVALVRLGFRGVVTTNFDPVLANAMSTENARGEHGRCEALDLGDPRSFAIFDFVRATSQGATHDHVLHLHGYYRHPDRVVLAASDYRSRYGDYEGVREDGRPVNLTLDTLHRKVIWSLLVAHPTLFVGFSLSDEALRHILRVTQVDFQRGRHLDHFALVGAFSEDDESKLEVAWKRYGITPVFYRVVESPELGPDHSDLEAVVERLGADLGIDVALNAVNAVTIRMLEL